MSYPRIFGANGEPYGKYVWDRYNYPKTVPGKTIGWHFSGGTIRILRIYYWDVGVNPYDEGAEMHYASVRLPSGSVTDEVFEAFFQAYMVGRWVSTDYYHPIELLYFAPADTTWRKDYKGDVSVNVLGASDEPGELVGRVSSDVADAYPENGLVGSTWYIKRTFSTDFVGNGYGELTDCIYCHSQHAVNGIDEIELQYPVDGKLYDKLQLRNFIVVDTERTRQAQQYRIYRITKPINGIVTVFARHKAYDLTGIVVRPYTAETVATAVSGFNTYAINDNPFTFTNTHSGGGNFTVSAPKDIWSLMGGTEGSVLDVFGGEWDFDNDTITLRDRLGADKDVVVRYGSNLTDLEQDANCANCYTGIVAYWSRDDVVVYTGVVDVPGTFDYSRILTVDMSEKYEEQPTVEALTNAASSYITTHNIGVPKVSWKINFIPLEMTEEYKEIAHLERVMLGDKITVLFDRLGVNASARIIEIEWDVLLDRYISVTLGSARSNIVDTIAGQSEEIASKPGKGEVQTISAAIAEALAKVVAGASGGYAGLLDRDNDGQPDTLYIGDSKDINNATNIWIFNKDGWAGSKDGGHTWTVGATVGGGLLAEFVTAAHLTAGTITSADGESFVLDLDASSIAMKDGTILMTNSVTYTEADYTSADETKASGIVVGRYLPTKEDLLKYDVNGDGKITISDVVIITQVVRTGRSITLTIVWRLEITPSGIIIKKKVVSDGQEFAEVEVMRLDGGGLTAKIVSAENGIFDNIVTKSLSVNEQPVVVKRIIGYFVYGANGSYNSGIFIPRGVAGDFQISSNDWYSGFYFDGYGSATRKKGADPGYSVSTLYNDGSIG